MSSQPAPDPHTAESSGSPGGPKPVLWLVALLALTLLPYAQSGFYGDDSVNSTLLGELKLTHRTLWEMIVSYHHSWMARGRFYPLGLLITYVHWAVASKLWVARCIQLGLIFLDIFVAARFFRRLTGSKPAALVFAALLPAFFQARAAAADPMTSFSPLLQVTLLFVILSADCFLAALESRSAVMLVLAWIFCAAGLLTYEVALASVAIVAVFALFYWRRTPAIARAGLGGFILMAAAYVGINLYLKAHAVDAYNGTTIGMQPGPVLKTFAVQATAAVPFIYRWVGAPAIFHEADWPSPENCVLAVVILGLTIHVVQRGLTAVGALRGAGLLAVLTGGGLLLVPPVFIAISARYQQELTWGVGYLPVFLQFFGLAFFATVLVCLPFATAADRPAKRTGLRTPLAVMFGVLAGVGNAVAFLLNAVPIEYGNIGWRYPREVIEAAAQAGFFDQVPEGSVLVREQPTMWDVPEFYRLNTHRRYQPTSTAALLADVPDTFFGHRDFSAQPLYELRYGVTFGHEGGGWAVLARLQSCDYRKTGATVKIFDRRLIDPVCFQKYVGFPELRPTNLLDTGLASVGTVPGGSARATQPSAPLRSGPGWIISRLLPGEYRVESSSADAAAIFPRSNVTPVLLAAAPGEGGVDGKLALATSDNADGGGGQRVVGVGFGCEWSPEGVVFPAMFAAGLELGCPDQSRGFGLAFRVRPGAAQVPNAVLVSNHRGNARGFTLERTGGGPADLYNFVVGDGGAWHVIGTIRLPADRWSTVVLGFGPAGSSLRAVTGTEEQGCAGADIPAPVGDDIVRVGNWVQGDRPFQGVVKDFTLLARPFTTEEGSRLTGPETVVSPSPTGSPP